MPVAISELKSTQVLPMWEYTKFVAIKVDTYDSCEKQHVLVSGPWHRYLNDLGQMFAVRCPRMLSHDEKARVLPEAGWEEAMAARRVERLKEEAIKRLEEKRAAGRQKFNG